MAFFDSKETKTTMKIDNSEYIYVTFLKHTNQKEVHRFKSQKEDIKFWFKISVSIFLQLQNLKAKGKKN